MTFQCERRAFDIARKEKVHYDYHGHELAISYRPEVDSESTSQRPSYVQELRVDFTNEVKQFDTYNIPLAQEALAGLEPNQKIESFYKDGLLNMVKTTYKFNAETKELIYPKQEKLTIFEVRSRSYIKGSST